MSFIKRVFEKLSALRNAVTAGAFRLRIFPQQVQSQGQLANRALMDQAHWRKNVLPSALQARWDDPEKLSSLVRDGMRRGCDDALVGAARRLAEIDKKPGRGAFLEGQVLLKAGRLDEAETALKNCMAKHGESSQLLTNLAKVYAERGDQVRAELTLWRGLRLDPNQDEAVQWWGTIHRERFGQLGYVRSLDQVSAVPGSWRPQLWLARVALEEKDFAKSRRYYRHVLTTLKPIPEDVMSQITGDLANAGRFQDVVELVAGAYDAEAHGLVAGTNIIKSYVKTGQPTKARAVLNQMAVLNRSEWREHLDFWQDQLDRAPTTRQIVRPQEFPALVLETPVWCHTLKDFDSLLPPKAEKKLRIAFAPLSSRDIATAPEAGPDNQGMLSRVIPLFLAEQIHMLTTGAGVMIVPLAADGEIAADAKLNREDDLLNAARTVHADYLIAGRLDVSQDPGKVELVIRNVGSRTTQARLVGTLNRFSPGGDILALSRRLQAIMLDGCDLKRCIRPISYHLPSGDSLDLFIEGLAESLAMSVATAPGCGGSMLYLERSILQYLYDLAAQETKSDVTRLLFISALTKNRAYGSQVFKQFADKADKLLRDNPLSGHAAVAARSTLADLFPEVRFAVN